MDMKKIELDAYFGCQKKILTLTEPGKRLLDIGCGDGAFTAEVAKKSGIAEAYGIDVDEDSMKQARSRGIRVQKGNANQKFPFQDNFFDVIIANQVVEHLMDPDNFLKEIRRVLKRGGMCVIATPNLNSLHNRLFVLLGWQITNIVPSTAKVFGNPNRGAPSNMHGPFRHLTVFSPLALKEMCLFYGLKPEKVSGAGFHPFKGTVSRFLSGIFPKMSVFTIVKCRKM